LPQIATPTFGYKTHISIDRRFGFIRKGHVRSAADSDGRQLKHVIDKGNTASSVWADTAYRSKNNEGWLTKRMMASKIHRKKPKDKPMPQATKRRIGASKTAESGPTSKRKRANLTQNEARHGHRQPAIPKPCLHARRSAVVAGVRLMMRQKPWFLRHLRPLLSLGATSN
jgi:IS5 family transposase